MVVDGQRIELIRYARHSSISNAITLLQSHNSPQCIPGIGRMNANICTSLHHCICPTAMATHSHWANYTSFRAQHPMQQQQHTPSIHRSKQRNVHDRCSGTICCSRGGLCGGWSGHQVLCVLGWLGGITWACIITQHDTASLHSMTQHDEAHKYTVDIDIHAHMFFLVYTCICFWYTHVHTRGKRHTLT